MLVYYFSRIKQNTFTLESNQLVRTVSGKTEFQPSTRIPGLVTLVFEFQSHVSIAPFFGGGSDLQLN